MKIRRSEDYRSFRCFFMDFFKELSMKKNYFIILFILFFVNFGWTKKEIHFDGYTKIIHNDRHVGYIIQRYEYDDEKKEYISTYYLKTKRKGEDIVESLKARASLGFKPLAYDFKSKKGKLERSISAIFTEDNKMKAKIIEPDGKVKVINEDVPKGIFLSTFLNYLIINNSKKIKEGTQFTYKAIAEENGEIYDGKALIKSSKKFKGTKIYKISNKFNDVSFESIISENGETVMTNVANKDISSKLVAKPNEAIKGFTINTKNLSFLFGNIPDGKNNLLAKKSKTDKSKTDDSKNDKGINKDE